jgi:hypothetical protein
MRILGYIILIVGCLVILMEATIGQSERCAIWLGRTAKVLSENNVPADSPVASTMFEMNRFWRGIVAQLALPAVMMLIGGILLDQARRNGRKRSPNKASEATSETAPSAVSSSPQG